MPLPPRTRLACDRCHGQKLRCPKEPGIPVCTRCAKAGADCIFSPRTARGPGGTAELLGVDGGALDLIAEDPAAGWPFEDGFEALMRASAPEVCLPEPDRWPQDEREARLPFNPQLAFQPHSVAAAPISHRLAEIMADMDAVLISMPPESALHFPSDNDLLQHTADFQHKYLHKDSIEKIFSVIQRLIEAYPDAVTASLSPGSAPGASCQLPNCVHHLKLPPELAHAEAAEDARRALFKLDLALANLPVSCHLRLLDLLGSMNLCVLSCFRISTASPDMSEPDYGVPDIRVGSFTPAKEISVMMQMALLKHLISSLGELLRSFEESLAGTAAGSVKGEVKVVIMLCELLRARHDAKMEVFQAIDGALGTFSRLKQQASNGKASNYSSPSM